MQNHGKDFKNLVLHPIAKIKTDFPTKFGIPRQGDVVKELLGTIVFEPEFRKEGILRGLEGFSHLWLIFGFSESAKEDWKATVRPPKLGGNERVGVFASRSTYRPNPLGLSAVKIEYVEENTKEGLKIHVSGVDLVNDTPIYDIKPYLPYADMIPDAKNGFGREPQQIHLEVEIPEDEIIYVPQNKRKILCDILAQDPRPGFHHDDDREYKFEFASLHITFKVVEDKKVIVSRIRPIESR